MKTQEARKMGRAWLRISGEIRIPLARVRKIMLPMHPTFLYEEGNVLQVLSKCTIDFAENQAHWALKLSR